MQVAVIPVAVLVAVLIMSCYVFSNDGINKLTTAIFVVLKH